VGAGPGDARLITLYGADLVKKADVILYDGLVNQDILDMAPASTAKVYVGRAVGDDAMHQDGTNELMAQHAETNETVVRLKGGDPMMFGRGGEEAEYLKKCGIPYEIVPGITSGIGSAAYVGIPLTHRKHASSVAFVTGHEDPAKSESAVKWNLLAKSVDSIVVMMGLSSIRRICKELTAGGMEPCTPAAVIQDGTTDRQRTVLGDLATIADIVEQNDIRPPANIIIGNVVSLSKELRWR